MQFRTLRARMMARRGHEPSPEELAVVWLNVAFSASGLRRLIDPATVDEFEDIIQKWPTRQRPYDRQPSRSA